MDARAALARLDRFGSADAIAQHLRDIGCRGVDGYNNQCPIARYVSAETGHLVRASSARIWDDSHKRGSSVATPTNVATFIERFDDRAYPDLIVGMTSDEVWIDQ